jgi:trk system potassium uptake protein TrkA
MAREFAIIGLGKFGSVLGRCLREKGQTVIGIDTDPDKVRLAAEYLSHAYVAEATDKTALMQLGLADCDEVIVSTGHSMEASILITLFLKEIGCKRVIVKAASEDHEKILRKVGADEVIFPEGFAAQQLAAQLAVPGFLDYLPLGEDVVLRQICVREWAGKSLRDLDLTNQFGIQVVAVRKAGTEHFSFVPSPHKPLSAGDLLVCLGPAQAMDGLTG